MDSLPPLLLDFISVFRPLMRAEVFDSFTYLLCGLLIGEAKHDTVRVSVFASPDYQPQRLSDLFRCHKLSRQALMFVWYIGGLVNGCGTIPDQRTGQGSRPGMRSHTKNPL
jgi:hypothetical protein